MKSTIIYMISILLIGCLSAQDQKSDFISLFNGENLEGWTPTKDKPESFSVEDGELVCRGGRAHLFYSGEIGGANFKNFELKLKIKTQNGSNSGVYFHTQYQKNGWPKIGFEAQVNSTHSDPKKTGSLYGIVNIFAPLEIDQPFLSKVAKNGEIFILQDKAPSTDGEWFDYYIKVEGNHIIVKVNDIVTVDWTQPKNWTKERRIGSGTVGFQAHDPTCEVHYKDIKIRMLD